MEREGGDDAFPQLSEQGLDERIKRCDSEVMTTEYRPVAVTGQGPGLRTEGEKTGRVITGASRSPFSPAISPVTDLKS